MNIVLDTNVLIAAFTSRGACNELYEHCLANYTILCSEWIINEFSNNLENKFKIDSKQIEKAVNLIRAYSQETEYTLPDKQICRDRDDDHILALAESGDAQCIVTGDKDLLILKLYKKIPIVKPSEFWRWEESQLQR